MSSYELVWDDSRTARLRQVEATSLLPVAWLRVDYSGVGHVVRRVEIYTHATAVVDRLWRGSAETVPNAVAFCDRYVEDLAAIAAGHLLPASVGRAPRDPWTYATVVTLS